MEGFRWDGEFVGEEGRKEEKGEVKKWEELSEGKMIDLVKFYTAMYHSFCAPTNYTGFYLCYFISFHLFSHPPFTNFNRINWGIFWF